MSERHPAPEPEMLERFTALNGNDAGERWLTGLAIDIDFEAKRTKCEHIRYQDALLVLTYERWERGILTSDQRDRLVRRIYG